MLLPTVHGANTNIPNESIECLLTGRIFRITANVREYALKEGMIYMWNEKQRIFQQHSNVDAANRACFHTMGTYGWNDATATEGELRRIEEIGSTNMALCYFLVDWKTMTPAQRREYEQTTLTIAGELENVVDEHKVRMKNWMLQASTVRDSLGRENVAVTRNRQSSSAVHGEKRADDIREICHRYDPRKVVLWDDIRKNESDLRKTLTVVRSALVTLETGTMSGMLLEGLLLPFIDVLKRTHDLPCRHAFRKSAGDIKASIAAAFERNDLEVKKRLRWVDVSLGNLEKERELAQWRLETAMAVSRRPRRNDELELQFRRLVALRQSCEVTADGKWKTKIMNRFRDGLDKAILCWPHVNIKKGSFKEVSEALDEAIAGL